MSFMRSIFCPPFYKMVRSCYTICGGWTKYPGKEKPEVFETSGFILYRNVS